MLVCENCEYQVQEEFDYCPNCGALFTEFSCDTHEDIEAEGVCLICEKICCTDCGLFFNDKYLCNEHSGLEIYENFCRVYGSSDSAEVDYLISELKNNNFHPVRFDRKNSPISLGGTDYTLFKASGDANGDLINEIKIMVPLTEYVEAFELVNKISNLSNEDGSS